MKKQILALMACTAIASTSAFCSNMEGIAPERLRKINAFNIEKQKEAEDIIQITKYLQERNIDCENVVCVKELNFITSGNFWTEVDDNTVELKVYRVISSKKSAVKLKEIFLSHKITLKEYQDIRSRYYCDKETEDNYNFTVIMGKTVEKTWQDMLDRQQRVYVSTGDFR